MQLSMLHNFIVESIKRIQDVTEIISALIICVGVALAALPSGPDAADWEDRTAETSRRSKGPSEIVSFAGHGPGVSTGRRCTCNDDGAIVDQLGRLGAIAVIRTFLNYFLAREIDAEERDEQTIARPAEAA
jgi:hypothetical protein